MSKDRAYPATTLGTMYQVVHDWADRAPGAPAILRDGQSILCYRDLLAVIDSIGRQLNAFGIGRDDRVALVHAGGPDMAAGVLGIWSYATVVPMNPDYTVGEFSVYLRDLRVDAVVVSAAMDTPARSAAERLQLPLLELSHDRDGTGAEIVGQDRAPSATARPGPAGPDDIATVIVTSGTTTHSKIVPIRHRHLVRRNVYAAHQLELSAADRGLNLLRLYHSGGLNQGLCMALVAGGSIGVPQEYSVDGVFSALQAQRSTWCTGVYTFYHAIYGRLTEYRPTIDRVARHLRFMRCGNGRLEPDIAEAVENAFGVPLLATYGTSETGAISSEPLPPAPRKRDSVGTAAHENIAILDEAGRVLPPGVPGEVAVSGATVFDGYENDAAANAAAFVDGWCRTGDEGYFDADGYLFLTGRIKEIINRGGVKVTPNEVDDALLAHPAVRLATTFPVPHPTLGEEVAAAVVLDPGAEVTAAALSAFVRARLSAFKAPRRVVFVDEIPKGPTGKIQRHKLAAAFGLNNGGGGSATTGVTGGNGTAESAARAPSELEARLSSLWAAALGLERVGLDEDFFLLGGDSLQAVDLFLRIEKSLGRRLPRAILFEAGTVADMARRIEADLSPSCIVPIQPAGSRPPFFCVHDQDGDVLKFRQLAGHLDKTQPFYGIQCVGLSDDQVPFRRMDEMAAHYVQAIRKVQPSGPYHIGGYSFGGRAAYEIARRLAAAGERVALLALFDTYCPVETARRIAWHRDHIARLPWSARTAYTVRRLWGLLLAVRHALRLKAISTAWQFYENRRRPIPRSLRRPLAANNLIARDFRPEPYQGDAVLFKADPPPVAHPDVHEGWRRLIRGGLEVRRISGQHSEIMMEPHVRALARALDDCLRERQVTPTAEPSLADVP